MAGIGRFFFARASGPDPDLTQRIDLWRTGQAGLSIADFELVTAIRAWHELGIPLDRFDDAPLGRTNAALTVQDVLSRHRKTDIKADEHKAEFWQLGAYRHQ